MHYDHFVTSDRVNCYPAYMDREMRLALRQKMKDENLALYCGCSYYSPVKLEYGISVDGKIYPLHQGYEHSSQCVRSNLEKRNSAYIVQEDGTAKVFLGFNVDTFSIPANNVTGDAYTSKEDTALETTEDGREEEKIREREINERETEPKDTLASFILELNNDTYHERITAGKGMISADFFLRAVYARLKKVYIDGRQKSIRDLNINDDSLQFFYLPLAGIDMSLGTRVIFRGFKEDFSVFSFERTIEKERKNFKNQYGIDVEEALIKYNVMAAGFIYLRISKRQKLYRVIGRVHFFIVNENGLYCRDLTEIEELDAVSVYLKTNQRYKTIQFDRIVDDPKVWGIFSKVGKKQVIVCKPKVPVRISLNGPDHIAFGTKKLCQDDLLTIDRIFK